MPMPRKCLLGLLAPLVLATCTGKDASARATPGVAAGPAGGRPSPTVSGVGVVAEVNGAPVFAAELNQRAESRLARLRQEEYDIRKQVLDEIVAERLIEAEAKK